MSTPTDSVSPAPPTGSSNLWPLWQWFKRITDWIAGLSPSGESEYDTGWVEVPLRTGFTATQPLEARRVGRQVVLRGRVTGAFTTGNIIVADLPVGFRPITHPHRDTLPTTTTAAMLATCAISTAGALNISVGTAGTTTVNVMTSWFV